MKLFAETIALDVVKLRQADQSGGSGDAIIRVIAV
jgi:hypothetical protein